MNRVAITRCTRYEEKDVYEAVRQVADSTSFPDCMGRRVLVKPNILSDSRAEAGITTNPLVVEAVIRICQERGAAQVYVGDSPGLHTPSFHGQVCGIAEVCSRTGATWVDFSRDPVQTVLDGGEKVTVASIIDKVDFTISVAKFKTHQLMYTTGAVKNMFGIMPGLNKSPMHLRHPSRDGFADFITRLFRKARVAWALIDSVIGMEGPGPANGTLRYVGLMMGGADAFLVDRAQAIVMGHDPGTRSRRHPDSRSGTQDRARHIGALLPASGCPGSGHRRFQEDRGREAQGAVLVSGAALLHPRSRQTPGTGKTCSRLRP